MKKKFAWQRMAISSVLIFVMLFSFCGSAYAQVISEYTKDLGGQQQTATDTESEMTAALNTGVSLDTSEDIGENVTTIDEISYKIESDTTGSMVATVVKANPESEWVLIPESITVEENEVSVTAIGEKAFIDCKSLSVVVIPDGVTEIPNNIFKTGQAVTVYCNVESPAETVAKDNGWQTNTQSVSLMAEKAELAVGEATRVAPSDWTLPKTVAGKIEKQWSSSEDTVATVDDQGIITAVSTGEAVMTCNISGIKAETRISVVDLAQMEE